MTAFPGRSLIFLMLALLLAPSSVRAECPSAAPQSLYCNLRLEQFRPPDPRTDLANYGIVEGTGATHLVRNARELALLRGRLQPGDQVVLEDGEWRDQILEVAASGTRERPILIRPQTPGGVTITGHSRIRLTGEDLILASLRIVDTFVTSSSDPVMVRIGVDEATPCNRCILADVEIRNFNAVSPMQRNINSHYVAVVGRDVTIAHSAFLDQVNYGHLVTAQSVKRREDGKPVMIAPGLHIRSNLFRGRAAWDNSNNYQLIQIGNSLVQSQSAFTVIQANLFEDTAAPTKDTQAVVIKASDVVASDNTFRRVLGSLVLRHTDRVLVEHNFFLGDHQTSGGIRVLGANHWILHNCVVDQAAPPSNYYLPLMIGSGESNDVTDGDGLRAPAQNVMIMENALIGHRRTIALGLNQAPLLPRNVQLIDNLVPTEVSAFDLVPGPQQDASALLKSITMSGNIAPTADGTASAPRSQFDFCGRSSRLGTTKATDKRGHIPAAIGRPLEAADVGPRRPR